MDYGAIRLVSNYFYLGLLCARGQNLGIGCNIVLRGGTDKNIFKPYFYSMVFPHELRATVLYSPSSLVSCSFVAYLPPRQSCLAKKGDYT